MPRYISTRGRSTLAIGICARCAMKMPLSDMISDPNAPGLRVHARCADLLDPYRLPMRPVERIGVRFARPDSSIALDMVGIITEDNINFLITEDGLSWLIP